MPETAPIPEVLIVDDDADWREAFAESLRKHYTIRTAGTVEEARRCMLPAPAAVLLDLRLSRDDSEGRSGIEFLKELQREWAEVPVLMITAFADVETAVECMRLGAFDFIEKSSGLKESRLRLQRAIEQRRLAARVSELEHEITIVSPRHIVGTSQAVKTMESAIQAAARDGQITVLITGETGSGKELVAKAIHASGPRAAHPFVPVVVPAIPPSMLEAELFGHERGAFTDAREQRVGLLERAHRGVLLFDEIGELPLEGQIKLLRFLEERAVRRIGGAIEFAVDVQVLAATNADLRDGVANSRFRQDLFYRLNVFEIRVAPLRERRDDIPALIDYFLSKAGAPGRGVHGFEQAASDALGAYSWPGNIRELRNIVESSVLRATLNRRQQVTLMDLPADIFRRASAPHTSADRLNTTLARTELAEIEAVLHKTEGSKDQAWRVLGLNDRFALLRRVNRLLREHPALAAEFPAISKAYGPRPKIRSGTRSA